jgi:Fe2+ or Zn2+ uptake regulation protein
MNLDLDTLNAQLSERGIKLTRQRKAVVEVVTQAHARERRDVFTQAQRVS